MGSTLKSLDFGTKFGTIESAYDLGFKHHSES